MMNLKIKKICSFLLIMIIVNMKLSVPVNATTITYDKTPSGIKYENVKTEIDNFVKENENELASCEVSVFKNNDTIFTGYYGFSNIEKSIKADSNTVYEWGSMSKILVWVSVMQLYEEGKIDLDEDIRNYLPDNFLTKLKYDEPITMKNLMNHNAGWQETAMNMQVYEESKIINLKDTLKKLEPSQVYKPGECTAYSNWGTSLAAFIIENISGESYSDYVHNHILEPLNMNKTSVKPDCSDNLWVREKRKELKSYIINADDKKDKGNNIAYILLYPSGSVTGTISDLEKFAKEFVKGGDSLLFKNNETLNEMLEATSYFGESNITRNSHGLWSYQFAVDALGHGGNTLACSSIFIFDKESGFGVVIMTNEVYETTFIDGIPGLLFGEYKNNPRVLSDNNGLNNEDLSGMYLSTRTVSKGFAKFSKYLGGIPLSKTDNPNRFNVLMGDGYLERVGEHQFVLDDEHGSKYFIYETKNIKGDSVLELSMWDHIKDETYLYKIILICITIIISIFSLIYMIFRILKQIIKKIIKKKGKQLNVNDKIVLINRFAQSLVIIGLYFAIVCDGSTKFTAIISCIITSIMAIISIFSGIYTIKKLSKEFKLSSLLNLFSYIIIIIFIIYFQFFLYVY